MSGHSHWARIKHKKGAADAKKGKEFSKVAKLLMVAAKNGGGDPGMNLKLAFALEKAKACNLPKENIDRAIKKGTGELEGVTFEEITYEGYGPGGVAVLVEALTDNKNRTSPELRRIFDMHGGNLGSTNCVAWMFERKGVIAVSSAGLPEDQAMELALDLGADDVSSEDDRHLLTCDPTQLLTLRAAVEKRKMNVLSAEVSLIPKTTVPVAGADAKRAMDLLETLEEHEDAQNVYSNVEIPEELVKSS